MSVLIALEGNISVGKSTLCAKMPKEYKGKSVVIRYETIPKGLLALFYSGLSQKPNPYAFTLQINQLSRRSCDMLLTAAELKDKEGIAFFDRSLVGDLVFALQHYWNGNLKEEEFAVYLEEAKISQIQKVLSSLNYIFYLFNKPSDSLNNVRKRGDVDSSIPISLLEELDLLHGHVILWLMASLGVKVTVIDWSKFGTPDTIFKTLESLKSGHLSPSFTFDTNVKDNEESKEWETSKLLPNLKNNKVLETNYLHSILFDLSKGKDVSLKVNQNIYQNSIFYALDNIYSSI